MENFFITIFIIGTLTGSISCYFASRRGRNPFYWFIIGAVFWIVGVIVLFFLPEITVTPPKEEKLQPKPSPLTFQKWYYLNSKHEQQTPISFDQLKTLWKEGDLKSSSYVWTMGMDEWCRVKEYDDLLEILTTVRYKNL